MFVFDGTKNAVGIAAVLARHFARLPLTPAKPLSHPRTVQSQPNASKFCVYAASATAGLLSPLGLDRRTRHGSKGAEHAAVPRLRPQPYLAARALIEEQAGVGWHRFGLGRAAMRAGQGGFQDHRTLKQKCSPNKAARIRPATRLWSRRGLRVGCIPRPGRSSQTIGVDATAERLRPPGKSQRPRAAPHGAAPQALQRRIAMPSQHPRSSI